MVYLCVNHKIYVMDSCCVIETRNKDRSTCFEHRSQFIDAEELQAISVRDVATGFGNVNAVTFRRDHESNGIVKNCLDLDDISK